MKDKIEPVLDEKLQAVEHALMPRTNERSFAPPDHRGIAEILMEMGNCIDLLQSQLDLVKRRVADFHDLQSRFYNGSKP